MSGLCSEIAHHSALLAVCESYMRFARLVKSIQRRASHPEQAVVTDERYGTGIEQWIRPFVRASQAEGSVPSPHNVNCLYGGRIMRSDKVTHPLLMMNVDTWRTRLCNAMVS